MKKILFPIFAAACAGVSFAEEVVDNLTTSDAKVAVYDAKDDSGDKVMHFTNTTGTMTFEVKRACRVRLLAVGGGGAGNYQRGGGGGAGGLILNDSYKLDEGIYTVSVGKGGLSVSGAQSNSQTGALGKPTTLTFRGKAILTANGGGFGGYRVSATSGTTGATPEGGCSGGVGAGCQSISVAVKSVDGSLVNRGGLSAATDDAVRAEWQASTGLAESTSSGDNAAGGGGGAGSAGHCGINGSDGDLTVLGSGRKFGSRKFGDGGAGLPSDITGETLFYAAGGGGGGFFAENGGGRGLGGSGIGGNGAGLVMEDMDGGFARATAGLDGTGSGGGGSSVSSSRKVPWLRKNGNEIKATGENAFTESEGGTVIYTAVADDFKSGAGGSGALILRWTPYDPEAAKKPAVAIDACVDNGDTTGTAKLEVESLGEGGSSATVTLRYGLDASLADGSAESSVTEPGDLQLTLTDLIPGHTYFYRATVVNDQEAANTTPVRTFVVAATSDWPETFPTGLPVIGAASLSQTGANGLDLRVSGVLKQEVAGMQATLLYAFDETATPESMTRLPIADLGLGADESFAFTVDDLLVADQTIYCYLELSATTDDVTRTDLSARLALNPTTSARLGLVNTTAADYGAGYDSATMTEKVAILFTPGYGENIADIYFLPGTKPNETKFDEAKAVLVKTVPHAELCLSNQGAFTNTVSKFECPAEILWGTSYYYWVVIRCGDPDDPYVTYPAISPSTDNHNCFKYIDVRGPGERDGEIRFVALTGADEADGSAEHPWATIGHAVATANSGDEIRIQAGVYEEAVELLSASSVPDGLTLSGGWDENWKFAPKTAKTIITPPVEQQCKVPCIKMTTILNVFKNLTLTGGSAGLLGESVAGGYANNASNAIHLVQAVVISNNVTGIDFSKSFLGVAMVSSLVADNETYGYNHAIGHCGQDFLYNCTFARNGTAVGWNNQYLGSATIRNCVFEENGVHLFTKAYSYTRTISETCFGTATTASFTRSGASAGTGSTGYPFELFGAGIIEASARLDADFRPTANSPFNGRGVDLSANLSLPYTTDLEGEPYGVNWTYGCFASASPAPEGVAKLYVAETGNDVTNDGSQARPFRTIGAAVAKLADGGTVEVAAGTYPPVVLSVPGMTLVGAGRGKTVIRDSSTADPLTSGVGALTFAAPNVTVRGVTLTNAFVGVKFENALTTADQATVLDSDISGCVQGVYVVQYKDSKTSARYQQVERCRITDNLTCGVYNRAAIRMASCLIARNARGIQHNSSDIIPFSVGANLTIVDNTEYGIYQNEGGWNGYLLVHNSVLANNGVGAYRVNANYSGRIELRNCLADNTVNYNKLFTSSSTPAESRGAIYLTQCKEMPAMLETTGRHRYEPLSDSPCLKAGIVWENLKDGVDAKDQIDNVWVPTLKPEFDLNGLPIKYEKGFSIGCYQPNRAALVLFLR